MKLSASTKISVIKKLITSTELIASVEFIISTELNLQCSTSFIDTRGLKFKNSTSLICITHLSNETKLEFCYDTEFDSSFILVTIIEKYYSHLLVYEMKNDQKIRCRDLEENLEFSSWVKLSIKTLISKELFVTMIEKFHVMSKLSCDILIETNIMKSYEIFSIWETNDDSDHVVIQDRHRIEVRFESRFSLRSRRILSRTSIILSIKTKIQKSSRRIFVNVYFDASHVLSKEHEQNIEMHHKSFAKRNYVFESISLKNSVLKIYLIEVHVIMNDETSFVPMTNFEKSVTKIR